MTTFKVILLTWFIAGCTTNVKTERPVDFLDSAQNSQEIEGDQLTQDLSKKDVEGLRKLVEESEKILLSGETPTEELARYRHEKVKQWFDYFTKRDRKRFQRYLNRGQKYREVVETILSENGIPTELYFMAMIESGYSTHAYSRARAVGVWQFIKATGRRYGLRSNYYVDERRDPISATEGAVKYLRDLYNAFLSWELSMAAYNAGELRILRGIMDTQTRNFWELAKKKKLPRETRNYVPKFIAATIIGSNPEKYGFVDPAKDFVPYPSVVAIPVPSPINLKTVAKNSGIPHELLKRVNPHIRRGITPPYKSTYELWIPEAHLESFNTAKNKLSSKRLKLKNIYDDPTDHHIHRVRSGENLSVIASRYRMSVRTLKRINGLRSNTIHPGKKLRISKKAYRPKSKNVAGKGTHKVRSGDNLGLIARKYNTTVRALRQANNLSSNLIRVGQNLVIPK